MINENVTGLEISMNDISGMKELSSAQNVIYYYLNVFLVHLNLVSVA